MVRGSDGGGPEKDNVRIRKLMNCTMYKCGSCEKHGAELFYLERD